MADGDAAPPGWDVTMAVRTDEINRILAGAVPELDVDPPPDMLGNKCSAKVSGWQIVDQAVGSVRPPGLRKEVIFELTLGDVSILLAATGKVVTLTKVRANISMALKWVREHADGPTQALVFDPPSFDSTPGQEVFGWTLAGEDFPDAEAKKGLTPLLLALATWSEAHWSDLSQVFCTIDVFDPGDGNATGWLKPTSVDYACFASSDPGQSLICIMVMTEGRTPDHDAAAVLPTALPDGANALLHISRDLYMRKAIQPGLVSIAPGVKPEDFSYATETGAISLAGPVALDPHPLGRNDETMTNDYPCPTSLTSLQVTMTRDAVKISMTSQLIYMQNRGVGRSNWHSGSFRIDYVPTKVAICSHDQTSYLAASIVPDSQGVPRVQLAADPSRETSHSQVEKPPATIDDEVMGWVQIATDALGMVFAPIIYAIQMILNTPNSILGHQVEKTRDEQLAAEPSGLSVADAMASMNAQWGGLGSFTPTRAAIDDGLSVVGKLEPRNA